MRYSTYIYAISILGFSQLLSIGTVINNGSIPVVINEPGTYVMSEDVSYSATTNLSPIIIATSNVTLDLLGFAITQTEGFGFTVTGIQVQSGSVVNIKNGKVRQFTQSGISVASGVSSVQIKEINVSACGNRGIELVGTAASPISESVITNCYILASCTVTTADYALTLTNVNYTVVQDSFIDLNGSSVITGTFACIRATGFRNQFLNITMNDNTGGTDARGISLNNSVGTLIRKCNVNNLSAAGGGSNVQGFVCEANSTSTANIFQECIARALVGTATVDGFLSSTGCNDNYFQGCYSVLNQATATNGSAHGYRAVNNSKNMFWNCQARKNTAPNSTVTGALYGAYGFKLDTTTSANITECFAAEQSASTRAVGIQVLGGSSGNNINKNTCTRNGTSAGTTTANSGFGYDFQGTTGAAGVFDANAFAMNYAAKNTNGASQYNNFPAGAISDGVTDRTVQSSGLGAYDNVGISNT
jgi:hypothetical protein